MKSQSSFSELRRPVRSRGWRVESYVRAVAGVMILLSVALAVFVSQWWLLLTVFVGVNLIQSMLTGWCLMSNFIAVLFPQLREE